MAPFLDALMAFNNKLSMEETMWKTPADRASRLLELKFSVGSQKSRGTKLFLD